MRATGSNCIKLNQTGDQIGTNRMKLNQIGLNRIQLDLIESKKDQFRSGRIK